jgi:hypothetical protein
MPQVDSFRYVLDTAPVVFVAGLLFQIGRASCRERVS